MDENQMQAQSIRPASARVLLANARRALGDTRPFAGAVAATIAVMITAMVLVTATAGRWSTRTPTAVLLFWGAAALSLAVMLGVPRSRRFIMMPVIVAGGIGVALGPEALHAPRALILAATISLVLVACRRSEVARGWSVAAAPLVGVFAGFALAVRVIALMPNVPVDRQAWVFEGVLPISDIPVWVWLPMLAIGALVLRKRAQLRISVGLLLVPVAATLTVVTDLSIGPDPLDHGVTSTTFTIVAAGVLAAALLATTLHPQKGSTPHSSPS